LSNVGSSPIKPQDKNDLPLGIGKEVLEEVNKVLDDTFKVLVGAVSECKPEELEKKIVKLQESIE
jgi:hypothetical protein